VGSLSKFFFLLFNLEFSLFWLGFMPYMVNKVSSVNQRTRKTTKIGHDTVIYFASPLFIYKLDEKKSQYIKKQISHAIS
jgi:hypothetical protein